MDYKTIKYVINYGGFVGCEEEIEFEIDANASSAEIEDAVQEDFEEKIRDNCSWEIIEGCDDDDE